MKTSKYSNVDFESSSYTTPEFRQFAKDFESDIKALIKPYGLVLDTYSIGHFYVSGFVSRVKWNGDFEYVYFSISDVRFFKNEWIDNILIRTAKHLTDYTGGQNNYCTLESFGKSIISLLAR